MNNNEDILNNKQDVLNYNEDNNEDKIFSNKNTDNFYYMKIIILRTFLVLFCFILAITIPNFNLIIDCIGSTLVMLLQIVFPIMFYIYLIKPNFKERVISVILFLMGLFGLIFGIWAFIDEIPN